MSITIRGLASGGLILCIVRRRYSLTEMHEDEYENLRLRHELEQLKRQRDSEQKSLWVVWFVAIWLLPLFGMQLLQGDDLPKTAGPELPVVGQISIWGLWFLGVPLATFLYRKFIRDQ